MDFSKSPRTYLLVDANVLVHYYLGDHTGVEQVFSRIEAMRKKPFVSPITIFVPNICIAEVYKALARRRYGKPTGQNKQMSVEEYKKVLLKFSNDIARTDQWTGIDDKKAKEKEHFAHQK